MQQQTAQLAEQATEQVAAEAHVPSRDYIGIYAELLRKQLHHMSAALWKPTAQKQLRRFTSGEAAKLLGISDSRLRQLSLEGNGPQPEITGNGRRSYSLADIHLLRDYLDGTTNTGKRFSPRRRGDEHLQVIAVTNFKGGSAKTTTAAHLSQYLALQGYRVLGIDLDAQASLSALLGIQPELDVGDGETLYASIRYDEDGRRPLKEVIRETYFPGLHLVPGNLELTEFEHDTPRALAGGGREAMFFTRIQDALASVDDDYDVVVIDCPPNWVSSPSPP